MLEFDGKGPAAAALQRILEATHSLQTRTFRATARRRLNEHAINEIAAGAKAIEDAVVDLRELLPRDAG